MTKSENNEDLSQFFDILNAIKIRLDIIVLLLAKMKFSDANGKIKISEIAPILYTAGYQPKDIANFFGKKKATEVSCYLYPKRKK